MTILTFDGATESGGGRAARRDFFLGTANPNDIELRWVFVMIFLKYLERSTLSLHPFLSASFPFSDLFEFASLTPKAASFSTFSVGFCSIFSPWVEKKNEREERVRWKENISHILEI
jgi:hypothetical protein